jgi:hypothetical protein
MDAIAVLNRVAAAIELRARDMRRTETLGGPAALEVLAQEIRSEIAYEAQDDD